MSTSIWLFALSQQLNFSSEFLNDLVLEKEAALNIHWNGICFHRRGYVKGIDKSLSVPVLKLMY